MLWWSCPGCIVLLLGVAADDLAQAECGIALPHEGLGQGNDVRQGVAKLVAVVPDAGRIREPTGQDSGSRRSADRLLGIGTGEHASGGGEPINVRGNGQLVPVTPKSGPKVVDSDEEDIGASGIVPVADCRQGQEETQSYSQ